MFTKDKREPAFNDLDKMPFGKHKGESLQDVPASYLRWLWNDGVKEFSHHYGSDPKVQFSSDAPSSIKEKTKLANYIWNCKSAIEQELGETL